MLDHIWTQDWNKMSFSAYWNLKNRKIVLFMKGSKLFIYSSSRIFIQSVSVCECTINKCITYCAIIIAEYINAHWCKFNFTSAHKMILLPFFCSVFSYKNKKTLVIRVCVVHKSLDKKAKMHVCVSFLTQELFHLFFYLHLSYVVQCSCANNITKFI